MALGKHHSLYKTRNQLMVLKEYKQVLSLLVMMKSHNRKVLVLKKKKRIQKSLHGVCECYCMHVSSNTVGKDHITVSIIAEF